ncbi:thiamine-phosphate kinase [Candidatus Saganbacteria bacterium]|nr:thiamine-phosphate kinase [Candidatus Saganbacteria bacterium]
MKLSQLGEFGLIELLKKAEKKNKRSDTVIGIGDDCAVIQHPTSKFKHPTSKSKYPNKSKVQNSNIQKYQLITTDTMVEGVHFKLEKSGRNRPDVHRDRSGPFFHLGCKALFSNISDISAMGGLPTHAVVTVGFPENLEAKDALEIYNGMNSSAKKHKIDIVGGDTVASPRSMFISITLLGEVEKEYLLTRSGAKPGDLICVTGKFGGEAAARYKIQNTRYKSRNTEARILAKSGIVSSMIDSSDGLVRSVLEVCKASSVGALINSDHVPKAKGATLENALYGGEEYELVFTVPINKIDKLPKELIGKVTIVGEIFPKSFGVKLIDSKGDISISKGGYEHFKK